MKNICVFFVIALFCSSAISDYDICKGLEPVKTPRPEYPRPEQVKQFLPGTSYNHIFIKGHVKVRFTVQGDGSIGELLVISSENEPNKKIQKSMHGFLETSVLATVSKWLYKPVSKPCVVEKKFIYGMAENA